MGNGRAFKSLCGLAFALASAGAAGQDGADARRLAEETRKVAGDLVAQIRGELTKELEFSGPMRGVIVCKYTVPEISSAMSRKTGWRVTRVALRPRNPALGSADAWEQKVLLDFERRAERGEKPDGLEHGEVVAEPGGRYYRYMKALPLGPLCVSCHGAPDKLTPNLKALLETEYPHDRATGYAVGQIRGAVTIKRPL
ncbi:MAG: DUF3365 domain-containing protein [Betaproteobacteria bacterium]|nr:DUF3365 domain-containing protein [Betaproteobacteria bacterium]